MAGAQAALPSKGHSRIYQLDAELAGRGPWLETGPLLSAEQS